jgi:DNA-binding transcriptional regulator of glucitol operon
MSNSISIWPWLIVLVAIGVVVAILFAWMRQR